MDNEVMFLYGGAAVLVTLALVLLNRDARVEKAKLAEIEAAEEAKKKAEKAAGGETEENDQEK